MGHVRGGTADHQLETIVVGDAPEAWDAAGFSVRDRWLRIGNTVLELRGTEPARGIRLAELAAGTGPVDGLAFGVPESGAEAVSVAHLDQPPHPNEVVAIDHVVAMSPHMDRTSAALRAAGLDHRRTRRFDAGGRARRQEFFWLGDVILELVGDDLTHGDGPATLWGLAFTCRSLGAAAARLGPRLGAIKQAVQPGRQIATLRTDDLDISVPVVLMSPHSGSVT